MSTIQLLALDLDGTLLNRSKEISFRNQKALRGLVKQGIHVVFDTGRPWVSIQEYLQVLGLVGPGFYSITYNGGAIFENNGKILQETLLNFQEVTDIMEQAEAYQLPVDLITGDISYTVEFSKPSQVKYVNNTIEFIKASKDQISKDLMFNKVILSGSPSELDRALVSFDQDFKQRYEIVKTRDILLEIMPKAVNKAKGLEILSRHLNIEASQVLAMGDEANDIEMLSWAGIGVAPANATTPVKAIANKVSRFTNDEDAVAETIEEYLG